MPDLKDAIQIDGGWYYWDNEKNCLVELLYKQVQLKEATWKLYNQYFTKKQKQKEK